MKKHIFFIMFVLPACISFAVQPVNIIKSDSRQFIAEYVSQPASLSSTIIHGEVYNTINPAPEEHLLRIPGKAQLPFFSLILVVPPQGKVDFKVTVLESEQFDNLEIPIEPTYHVEKTETGGYVREVPFSGKLQDVAFPGSYGEIAQYQIMRGIRLAKINLYPYRYFSDQKKLFHATKMHLEVRFPPEPVALAKKPTLLFPFASLLKTVVANYEQIQAWASLEKGKENALLKITQTAKFSNSRLKILVSEDGLYRLTARQLAQAGFPVADVDPRFLQITFRGAPNPIIVSGEEDGRFDDEDFIVFQGMRNRGENGEFFDNYTDTSAYWLEINDTPGLRFIKKSSLNQAEKYPERKVLTRKVHFEKDLLYYQGDKGWAPDTKQAPGEGWIWRYFYPNEQMEFYFELPAIDVNAANSCKMTLRVRGITIDPATWDHVIRVMLNNSEISSFQFKDQEELVAEISVPASTFKEGKNTWKLISQPTEAEVNKIYLDWLEFEYPATTERTQGFLPFTTEISDTVRLCFWNQLSPQFFALNLSQNEWLHDLQPEPKQRYIIHLLSAGFDDGNWCTIEVNGQKIIDGGHRGHNLVVLDTLNGEIEDTRWFDTLEKTENSDSMAAYIGRIPEGKIVLVAIRDEGSYRMTEAAYQALESLGSALTRQVKFRDSYVLLGRKGAAPGTVPELLVPQHSGPAELTDTLFAHQPGNFALDFAVEFSAGDEWIICGSDSLKSPDRLEIVGSTNLTNEQNQADYIIITHRKFFQVAQAYKDFWEQRGLSVFIADVKEIYDQFNFGIKNPLAIKNFLKFAYESWQSPAPAYVLLLGDASWDPKKNIATSIKEDYVPSWGNPVADIWYVCLDGDEDWLPEMFIGRLPIEMPQQGFLYLEKMRDYENYPSARWKKEACFINGGFNDQEQYIFGYQTDEIIKDYVVVPPAALNPTVISKELDGLYEGEKREEIFQAISEGKLWVNFIGHGGSGTWELMFHDQQVFQLENQGKLPLVSSFTCHTGRFANPQITNFGENFILYSDAGAIAFVGTTGWGFIYEDNIIARALFKTILADSIREFGKALALAKVQFWKDVYITNRAEDVFWQYTLLGDPALKLTLPDRPDLTISPNHIEISPEKPVVEDSLLQIQAKIENYGIQPRDSVKIDLMDVYAFSGARPIFSEKIPPPGLETILKVPLDISQQPGDHTISLTIDENNQIEEVDEQNNFAAVNVYVGTSKLRISRPGKNMILPSDKIEFQVYRSDTTNERYLFELDTNKAFSQPISRSDFVFPNLFVANWQMDILDTGKVYFWRAKKVDEISENPWSFSDFYVGKEFGWGQFISEQMEENEYDSAQVTSGGISLSRQITAFRVESSGFDDLNYAVLFVNSTPVSTSARGHNIAIFTPYGEFVEFRRFDTHASAEDVAAMVEFLNSLPSGYIVLAGIRDSGAQEMTEAAYQALEGIGSQYCRNVGFRDAWAIIGKKGAEIGSVPESWVQRGNGVAIVEDTLVTYPDSGKVISSRIGPATKWKSLNLNFKNLSSTEDFALSVLGYDKEKFEWKIIKSGLHQKSLDLGDVAAENYPYLKLSLQLMSSDRFNSPQFENWRVSFIPCSDLAISEKTVSASRRQILQGDDVKINVDVYNLGYTAADSVRASIFRLNSQSESELLDTKIISSIVSNDVERVSFNLNQIKTPGEKIFQIKIDDQSRITELDETNNQAEISIKVDADTSAPRLTVTFDEKEILDGDFVSPNPRIEVKYFDDSPVDVSEDTSLIHIFIDGERVSANESPGLAEIFYYPDEKDSSLKALMRIEKEFSDGEHLLSAYGFDLNKNASHIEKSFRVVSKLALINVYNYPNPFSSSTQFTFHLTRTAEIVTIKIYTTSGRLIKTLEKFNCETGFHQIDWDGRDEDGDELANGVYLYKITAKSRARKAEVIEKCAVLR